MENCEVTVDSLIAEAAEIGRAIDLALNSDGMMKGCSKRSEVVKRREIAYELELIGTEEALKAAQEIRTQNRVFICTMEQH